MRLKSGFGLMNVIAIFVFIYQLSYGIHTNVGRYIYDAHRLQLAMVFIFFD